MRYISSDKDDAENDNELETLPQVQSKQIASEKAKFKLTDKIQDFHKFLGKLFKTLLKNP